MENKLLDKNSSRTKLVDVIKTKSAVDAKNPYPYLFGLCWALLNDRQLSTLAKIVNEMPDRPIN